MDKQKQSLQKLKIKFPLISIELIQKDILMDEILVIIKKLFENIKPQNFNWSIVGGTMLSKCYKEINRLSEDIDLTLFLQF